MVEDATTLKNTASVMLILSTFLEDGDSYLYLTAIQGLAALADVLPEQTIPQLAKEFELVGIER